jgi:hypothetical protein
MQRSSAPRVTPVLITALSQSSLSEFDHEMANTRKTLERVPEAKFAWQPHEKIHDHGPFGHSPGRIGRVDCHHARKRIIFDFASPGGPPYQPKTAGSRAELLEFDKMWQPPARLLTVRPTGKAWFPGSCWRVARRYSQCPRSRVVYHGDESVRAFRRRAVLKASFKLRPWYASILTRLLGSVYLL